MAKPQTRAQAFGVSPKILKRKTDRGLKAAAVALAAVAVAWNEVDEGFVSDIEALITKISEVDGDGEGGALQEAIERLAEPWGYE